MKLYVWHDVLTDYTSGVMFALAENASEARKLLLAECSYIPQGDLQEEPTEYDVNKPMACAVWGGS